ncbi:MAG: PorP/SprF family type IX secretion system membrane protein, partial [Bacteroidota bacterium]|nr:PorP/SprF family type IX secretion system membrane protein [Bacteroidota bacterium]
PKLALFNINGAINENMGLAFSFSTEKNGNFSQNYILATYSYHLTFSDKTFLSAAITPLYFRSQLDFSSIQSYGTQLDPMLQNSSDLSIFAFDLGVSLAFTTHDFNIGISVPQSIGMSFSYADLNSTYKLNRHYFAYLSYQFEFGDWYLEPIITGRTTESSPINYGGSVFVKFKNKLWTNVGYNANNSVLFSFGALSSNNLAVSYTYEFGFSGIQVAAMGTHEITFGFLIKPAKKFKNHATVFMPPKSIEIGTDENLARKVAIIENKVNQEQQDRINVDEELQRQVDSIKAVIANKSYKVDTVSKKPEVWLQRVVSQNITFGLMSDKIFSSSFSELDKYSKKLRLDKTLKMKILVYTDNLFSEEGNRQLSQQRAKSVANYLLSKPGIDEFQIEFQGMGSINPIGDNTTPVGREKNNRVEFLFDKKIF